MPFDAEFELPDGRVVKYEGIPDGTTQEQFKAQVEKEIAAGTFGEIKPKTQETPGVGANIRTAKIAGGGLAKGALSLPAVGADQVDTAVNRPTAATMAGPAGMLMAAMGLGKQAMDRVLGNEQQKPLEAGKKVQELGPKPVTIGEKYLHSVAEGVGGALTTGGMSAPGRAIITGAASGAGAEAGGQLTGDSWWGRLLGSVAGGMIPGFGGYLHARNRPQSEDLARVAMQNVDEADLKAAAALQAEAKAKGVDMDLAQALHGVGKASPELTAVRNAVANSRSGKQTSRVLNTQNTGLEQYADETIGGLPGPTIERLDAAREMTKAADNTLTNIRKESSRVYDDTVRQVRETLRATENLKVGQASQEALAARNQLLKLESQAEAVKKQLAASSGADEAAVNAANAQITEMRQQIEALKGFALPRGVSGTPLNLPGKGKAIDYDQIARETRAERLARDLPPEVAKADSMVTAGLRKTLEEAEGEVLKGQGALGKAELALGKANAGREAIDRIPLATVEKQVRSLDAEIARLPGGPGGMADDLKALRAKLFDGEGNVIRDPKVLDKALKEFNDHISLPTSAAGIPRGNTSQVYKRVAELRSELGPAMQPFDDASAVFKDFRAANFDPVKGGVVGQIRTNRALRDSDQVTQVASKLDNIFSSGSDSQVAEGARQIPKLASQLKKSLEAEGYEGAAEAFPAAAKSWMRGKLDRAFEGMPTGSSPNAYSSTDAAKNVYDSFFKNRGQMQGMRDIVTGIARSYDLPEHELVTGMEKFAQITKALTNAPRNLEGLSQQEIRAVAGSSMSADMVRMLGYAPMNRLGGKIQESALQKTFLEFDNILTSREGADLLLKLAKTPTMSPEAIMLIQQFGASQAAAQSTE